MKAARTRAAKHVHGPPPYHTELWLVISATSGGILFVFPTRELAEHFARPDRVVGPYHYGGQ